MHRFYFHRLGLCDEQTDTPQTTAGGAEPETKLTIGQQIKAAIAAKSDLQAKIATQQDTITTHLATLAARDAEIATLEAEIETHKAKITALEADAAEVQSALDTHKAEVATLKANEKSADAKAKEKLAALGFNSSDLPKQNPDSQAKGDENNSAEAKIRALEGNARIIAAEHYRKHGKLPVFMQN